MRKIDKCTDVPETLRNAPVPSCADDVKSSIYRADDVCKQLLEDQHYKCAYCECHITKEYNDVEHYRPKAKYYWLGYEWNNLLYACDLCNRTYKKDFFPLKNEANRVTAPADLDNEEPLIINPAFVEPMAHIEFKRFMMVGKTDEGKETIEMFRLNKRSELVHCREQLFELYMKEKEKLSLARKILEMPNLPAETIDNVNKIIELSSAAINQYKSKDTPYSGMLVNQ